jgi:pyruvate,orthophosphate dikinase
VSRYVFDFAEGSKEQKDLLGGKGANLAEMTRLGMPVPPGFTITTDACRVYLAEGSEPEGMADEIRSHLDRLEERMGRKLGDPDDPLLVSVRSGAPFSMPGMMETVLNVGLNDQSVSGLARQSGDERFALDSYRRLLQRLHRLRDHFFQMKNNLQEVRRSARESSFSSSGVPRKPFWNREVPTGTLRPS